MWGFRGAEVCSLQTLFLSFYSVALWIVDELSGGRTCPASTVSVSVLRSSFCLEEFPLSPGCDEELGWPVCHVQSSSEIKVW